ncbi:hypothetical protein CIPAW_06G062700 [Carya illinoinensis]|uniref:Uncharacterized protein n=1 Tax=Carya illinoinensis TaxID=32201 RepID=A0A8T1Q8P5_CARIL|nr:hypothetical protein CIPAW_06G062700 [Carya illinoinensis]
MLIIINCVIETLDDNKGCFPTRKKKYMSCCELLSK